MKARSSLALLFALALVAGFGYRAVMGVWKGLVYEQARLLIRDGKWAGAPVAERAAVGSYELPARRLAAESYVGQWFYQILKQGASAADRQLLIRAGENFLLCRCIAPAARDSWEGLGETYHGLEQSGRERRAEIGVPSVANPWERVGRPGRIAVGMMRDATERAPTWFTVHDKLAVMLWNYGLEAAAREAVRQAAETLPQYSLHWFDSTGMPRWFLEEFAESSRGTLGKLPFVTRFDHLLDLGKLEMTLERYDRAAITLEEALAERGDRVNKAQARFYLGNALLSLGRVAEAAEQFEIASEHPIFQEAGWSQIAVCAEKLGDDKKALQYLRRLRRAKPGDIELCLRFADLARRLQDWRAATESLQWARTSHPEDPRSYEAMFRIHVDQQDLVSAAGILEELARWPAEGPRVEALRAELESARAERPRIR